MTPTRTALREARQKLALLRAEVQIKQLQQTKSLLEGVGDLDRWASVVGDRSERFRTGSEYGFPSVHDRRYGRNWPLVQNEQDLSFYRQAARVLCDTSDAASGFVRGLTSRIVGDGFQYKVAAQKDQEPPAQLITAVERVLGDFRERNEWYGGLTQPPLEPELVKRRLVDGEFLTIHYCQDGGE